MIDQKMFSPLEGPMQKLMELNVKMMQHFSYIKPVDLFSAKKPEEFFQRNMEMMMQNNQMALNYMREAFSILTPVRSFNLLLTKQALLSVI